MSKTSAIKSFMHVYLVQLPALQHISNAASSIQAGLGLSDGVGQRSHSYSGSRILPAGPAEAGTHLGQSIITPILAGFEV